MVAQTPQHQRTTVVVQVSCVGDQPRHVVSCVNQRANAHQ
jgi:hypothetical protein